MLTFLLESVLDHITDHDTFLNYLNAALHHMNVSLCKSIYTA